MAEVGTLDLLSEIQALVSDKLQVVSYKWLSRNFSVSSNDAKRILQEFVEHNGRGLEIVYSLSGWLKNSSPVYRIQLVSGVKLTEVKKQFEDSCSIQVYSVQACIPKDPAALWNSEFVQAEELFDQSFTVDNCLRDNRFGGVSNSFVKRNVNGTSLGVAPHSKNAGITVSSRSSNALQTPTIPQQKGKAQQPSPSTGQSPSVVAPVVKTESNTPNISAQAHANVGKVAALPTNAKKVENAKSSSGTGGSLAKMWGRASIKSKLASPETNKDDQRPIAENLATAVATEEAQICVGEAIDTLKSDDDDDDAAECVNHRRASNGGGNRKRRAIFYDSDEDDFEDAVNLASPDPPKKHSSQNPESITKTLLVEKNNLNFEAPKDNRLKIKQEKTVERETKLPRKEDGVNVTKEKNTEKAVNLNSEPPKGDRSKIKQERILENESLLPLKDDEVIVTNNKLTEKAAKVTDPVDGAHQKDKVTDDTSISTKRRRVLKTRIDERGREVTEVVWEGEETENKNNRNLEKKDTVTETANTRPPESKKSPALASNAPSNPVSKAGAKKAGKGGVKDAKQGTIMSFFKKV